MLCCLLLLLFLSCNKGNDHSEHADVYTCPMHPTVVSDKPSVCPVCGMDLVRKAGAGDDVKISEELARVMKSPDKSMITSIKTVKPQFKSITTSVYAVGVVTYDTRKIYTVSARISGRIEKTYLKYEFQKVQKGEKIADVYSPELITAQRELIYLITNDSENQQLIDGAKRRLELLGLSSAKINELIQGKEPLNIITITSPYSGYIVTVSEVPPTTTEVTPTSNANSNMNGMALSSSTSTGTSGETRPNSPMLIREGDYVTAGQTLVKIVDPVALRIELNVRVTDAGMIQTGQQIQLDYGNGNKASGHVDFIQPFFNEGENFVKLRVYTKHAEALHIGHLVNAKIELKPKESLWVPRESVLDLGTSKVVFIKDGPVLQAKKVTTGVQSGKLIEVTGGMASSDEIASNAQYLIDSESFIKPVN